MQTAASIESRNENAPASFPQKRLEELYERGLYLQAYTEGNSAAIFPNWPGTDGQVLAGKLAQQLGAMRLGKKLLVRAWIRDPKHPLAAYYYSWQLFTYRGPLACWDFLNKLATDESIAPRLRSDLIAAKCRSAAVLRDFETAEKLLTAAQEANPEVPWLHCERANLLEFQDRYEEALEEVQKAFVIIPFYRPAVQCKAHLLMLVGREKDALEFLQVAAASIESGAVYGQLFTLQMELDQHAAALETMQQYIKHSPLLDEPTREWLNFRRCDALYFSGQYSLARQAAEQIKDEHFFKPLAARLKELEAKNETPRRKLLPIGFVRLHHFTCVPATLTTLCRYWDKPADHLALAEKICYDGTPAHSERNWAEQNGFVTREFRVTAESAEALIDRGIPFTLTTSETTSSHLQAVIGYDRARETLYIRDPYVRHTNEFHTERSLKRYASTGPRGLALVPKEKAELLTGLDLPDAALYDQIYELNLALERHDRARAQQVFENLRTLAPDHRLTWQARRTLGHYDGNNSEAAAAVDALLKQFPEDGHLQIAQTNLWRDLGRREERL
ncbi:MAG TPA: C39 family peptidase, partial [Candidatus Kapabacteria bacterium]|nr:C39 family peptidase [Candidatus Kapabacteria bacterium]